MIRRAVHILFICLALGVSFIIYLATTIQFEDDYAHLLFANGEVIDAQVSSDYQWRIQCDGDLPEKLATTLLLFEDQYFHYHPGINPVSIIKAAWDNIEAGRTVRGGSTISMQLARVIEGNRPRTYLQKCKEVVLAFALELRLSKEEILQAYAQHAPFGGNTIGYCGASMRYYGKPADHLSWTEAATLSVLPNAPGKVYPGKGQEILIQKRDFLLRKLLDEQLIDSITYRLSILGDLPEQSYQFTASAPHLLQQLKGNAPNTYNHTTTIDPSLQRGAYRMISQYQQAYSDETDVSNIAAIILRRDGSIASYLANTSCGSHCSEDVDILQSRRSPGSTLKPFLYGAALDQGMITPQALLEDTPVFYNGYSPGNYDKTYRGVVRAEEALTRSLNVPAVNLLHDYGVSPFLEDLRQLGLSTMQKGAGHYGLSLILGGSEVMPIELAQAYCNLSRTAMGLKPVAAWICNGSRTQAPDYFPLSEAAAYNTIKMLEGVHRPSGEDGWEYFDSRAEVSWKTGTSFGMRDAWAVGTTTEYTVLVWVGNADGAGRPGLTGVDKAAPIMFDLFTLLPRTQQEYMPPKQMLVKKTCKASGYTPTSACNELSTTLLPITPATLPACPYHQTITLDTSGKYRVYRQCVREVHQQDVFVLPPVVNSYYRKSSGKSFALPPFLADCASSQSTFEIVVPLPDAQIVLPTDLDTDKEPLVCKALADDEAELYWFLDGSLVSHTVENHEVRLEPGVGNHKITVVSGDGDEQEVAFTVLD